MAIYHFHVGVVSRATGRSSVAAAAYRSAEKLHNKYDGITHDFTNRDSISAAAYRSGENLTNSHGGKTYDYTQKSGVVYSEIMLPENAPDEYQDRETLWNAVEKAEKRYDAQTARDIDLALPAELNRKEQIDILREYIKENFVNKGMIADFAIHDKADGNPHAHIMLTMRDVNARGFGKKNRDWNKVEYLEKWRENWAEIVNREFERRNIDKRINHRTLEAQGIDREPTIHVGRSPERARINAEIIKRNEARNPSIIAEYMKELRDCYDIIDNHLQDFSAKRREFERLERRIKDIEKRKFEYDEKKTVLEKATEQQKQTKFWDRDNKKELDTQINRLTNALENSQNYFMYEFKTAPEMAGALIQGMFGKLSELGKMLASESELYENRNMLGFEYQWQKLIAETRPDGKDILSKLKPSQLNYVKDDNFERILRELSPEQAKMLRDRREREHVRPHTYTREYERTRERSYERTR